MSKAEKLRDRLAAIQKEREEFEKHKRELENEMHIGKQNIGKIQKGLKNNLIINDPVLLENNLSPSLNNHSTNNIKKTLKKDSQNAMNQSFSNGPNSCGPLSIQTPDGTIALGLPTPVPTMMNIIPSGPRISDWCFTGSLESSPPVVKSREMYENVRLLGRGAFGEVNLVKNLEDNKLFAIKTILCPKDNELGPVLREIRFLRANRHPCIIDVHDAFITSNPRIVHIVMHYCESGTLSSVISSARKNKSYISEPQILKWFVQLLLALNFLHSNHTLHRDLKPMNVMLTEGGELLKVADFGLAVDLSESGESNIQEEAGTPYYTAPEMIQRESYSYPADCWSFGIILYQLLTLDRPFEGSSTAELVKSILTSEPSPITAGHYSDEIKAISMGLLRKNPQERLSTNNLVLDPWLKPKVSNFPQVYRPKYLEERIRRSHTKQLEQQIELIFLNSGPKIERRSSEGAALSKPSTAQGSARGLNASQAQQQQQQQLQQEQEQSSPTEHISLDVLPTLLEHIGSLSCSEKVTVNHKSFIIDDESIIQTLNAQQQASIAAANEHGAGLNTHPSPIKHAKADINIVDGVFGNEKFLTIDVKITPKSDPESRRNSMGPLANSGDVQQSQELNLKAMTPKPVLELRYTTEIKLPQGAHSELLHHHHHHASTSSTDSNSNHHSAEPHGTGRNSHNRLPSILINPESAVTVDPNSVAEFTSDQMKQLKAKIENEMSKSLLQKHHSNHANDSDMDGQENPVAIVRQASTSMINGQILNSSVEEIITKLNNINIDELHSNQFQRISDSIENVLTHQEELSRVSQKSSTKNLLHSDHPLRAISEDEAMDTQQSPLPVAHQGSGGRIGKHIAEAIENDHQFEAQLNAAQEHPPHP